MNLLISSAIFMLSAFFVAIAAVATRSDTAYKSWTAFGYVLFFIGFIEAIVGTITVTGV